MTWQFGNGIIARAFYDEEWLLKESCFLPIDLKGRPYMVFRQGKDQPWANFYWDCIFFCYKCTIDVWAPEAEEWMCHTNPPDDERLFLEGGPTYETEILAHGGPESKRVWDRVFKILSLKEGDYFEFNTTYPSRDIEILAFILQKRIKVAKPKRPIFIAIRSPFEFSLMDDELDFNTVKPFGDPFLTPSVLGGLLFYKNACFYLDSFGADGKYPDFFFPLENDWILHPENDFNGNISLPLPVVGPILDPIIVPLSDAFNEWDIIWGEPYDFDIFLIPFEPDLDWRPLFIQKIDAWFKALPLRITVWISDNILYYSILKLDVSDFKFRKWFFKKIARFFSSF